MTNPVFVPPALLQRESGNVSSLSPAAFLFFFFKPPQPARGMLQIPQSPSSSLVSSCKKLEWGRQEIKIQERERDKSFPLNWYDFLFFLFVGLVYSIPQRTVYVNAHHGVCMLLLRICSVCLLWSRSVLSSRRWQHILSQSAAKKEWPEGKTAGVDDSEREEWVDERRGEHKDALKWDGGTDAKHSQCDETQIDYVLLLGAKNSSCQGV